MSDFNISHLQTVDVIPSDGFGLVLTDPQEVPHISVLVDGKVISLTIHGISEKNAPEFFQAIKRKNIPVIFLKLKVHPNTFTSIRKHFEKHDRVVENVTTCIEPVKSALEGAYQLDLSNCSFIYEVIEILEKQNLISSKFTSILPQLLNKNSFSMRKYCMDDVTKSIIAYRNRTVESYAAAR